MAGFRLARRAEADIAKILATSGERWGSEARRGYEALLAVAMRQVAANSHGATTRARPDLDRSLRSFHIRHARKTGLVGRVESPVHVIYYRAIAPDTIEIIRVLHERMEPRHHM